MTEVITSLDEKRRARQAASLEARQWAEAKAFVDRIYAIEHALDVMDPIMFRLVSSLHNGELTRSG
jgi:hypothetical protein